MPPRADLYASYTVVGAVSALLAAALTTWILDRWDARQEAAAEAEHARAAAVVVAPPPAPEVRPAPAGARNVVFLMWDTARADRMSLYGHDRPTTPNLERFAVQSAVWDNAISPSFWTVPSHASLFTGLPVRSHGTDALNPWLAERNLTLAEHFRANGWATWAFTSNPNIGPETNLAQGFDVLLDQTVEPWGTQARERVAAKLIPDDASSPRSPAWPEGMTEGSAKDAGPVSSAALLEWLDAGGPGDRPFFAFVNFMEIHAPRLPSAEARRAVGLSGRLAELALKTPAGFEELKLATRGERVYTDDEKEAMRAVYDASTWELDQVTGALIDALDQRGHRDDTVVVIVSDHGDEIGEHGIYGHNLCVYDTLVHVPLVIRGPGVAPGRHAEPVSTAGLYGTLAALAGVPIPGAPTLEETTPVAELTAPHGAHPGQPERNPAGEIIPQRRRFSAIYEDHWKLVLSSADERELFDRASDPGERNNLASREPARATALEALLDAWLARTPEAPDGPLPEAERRQRKEARRAAPDEQAEQLKALGYVQ